jgi:nicotinamide-nucleotide amidase
MTLNTEIVTTGTEILLGEIVDTNAAWIAQQLREIGVNLYYKTTVGDNLDRVMEVLALGMVRSDVILVTGGLGPTADDITRQAIADAAGRPLLLHEEALTTLRARFARWGYHEMSENNVQQVYFPQDATLIENPVGTAPGFIVETGGCAIIAMPGVPREMKRMMADTVLPYLSRRNGDGGVIRRRILRTVGIGESTIDQRIRPLMAGSNPTIGLAAHTGQVDVRITARAQDEAQADALIDQMAGQLQALIGRHIYSTTPGETVEAVVGRQLVAAQRRLILAETSTGGGIARRLLSCGVDGEPLAAHRVLGEVAQADEETATALAATLLDDAVGHAPMAPIAPMAPVALVILGAGADDSGAYGKDRGETVMALAWRDADNGVITRTARFPYAGTDDLSIAWIGNRALDLIRTTLPNTYGQV